METYVYSRSVCEPKRVFEMRESYREGGGRPVRAHFAAGDRLLSRGRCHNLESGSESGEGEGA